jgi:hypothetical protein
LFTLGLIVVASLRTVGHYVLENIKVKSGNGINPKMYKGILFVFKDELSSVLGNRKLYIRSMAKSIIGPII